MSKINVQTPDADTAELLKQVSDFDPATFEGAFNIRSNGGCIGRQDSENIKIENKEGNPGLVVRVAPGTKGEKVFVPACITVGDIDDLVYNDFYIGENADVTIVAGCGIHTTTGEQARHNGIHRFILEKGAKALYEEKHIGTGKEEVKKIIDPVTEIIQAEDSYFEIDSVQLGGVASTLRKTNAKLEAGATLVIRERILTDNDEIARTEFEVELNGEDAGVNLVSRSVARGNSLQSYESNIIGNAKCYGHSECDGIIAEHGRVEASPKLIANNGDAQLIHEAAIGKIAGEQILKLRTLGLTEEEAEAAIVDGFLR